ncbi:virginiamycin B lyase, partial [Streptomyces sp. SID11233]|nr:virginiamycin B lyase [Streptomyces sp. SID11233]
MRRPPLTAYDVSSGGTGPYSLATGSGPDGGALWFTYAGDGRIGRFVPGGGGLTSFALAPDSRPT